MAGGTLTTISPSTNQPILTRQEPNAGELQDLPKKAHAAYLKYRTTSLSTRQRTVKKALQLILDRKDELARELTEQMGRPISYTEKEITTAVARGEYMLKISSDALKDTPGQAEHGFQRCIRKTPLGVVLVLFAWNVRSFPSHPTYSSTLC